MSICLSVKKTFICVRPSVRAADGWWPVGSGAVGRERPAENGLWEWAAGSGRQGVAGGERPAESGQ